MSTPSGPRSKGAKTRQTLSLWALALAMSAGLAAAGERWPEPLAIRDDWILLLLLGPPGAVLVVLLLRWRLPVTSSGPLDRGRGESGGSAQESD